jgi:hypothetical protein
MSNREVIYGGVEWDGTSLDRGAARAVANFGQMRDAQQKYITSVGAYGETVYKLAPAEERHGQAMAASGEKMARYGLLASKFTGTLSQIGVSSEVMSAGVQVATECLAGMASTALLVAGGVGLVVAVVASLVKWQTDLRKATAEATAELVKQANLKGQPIASPIVREATEIQLAAAERERAKLQRDPLGGGAVPGAAWAGAMGVLGVELPSNTIVDQLIGKGAVAEKKIQDLTDKINVMRQALNPVSLILPETKVYAPGAYDVQATDAQLNEARLLEQDRRRNLGYESERVARLPQGDFSLSNPTARNKPGQGYYDAFQVRMPEIQPAKETDWFKNFQEKSAKQVAEYQSNVAQMTSFLTSSFQSAFAVIDQGGAAMARSLSNSIISELERVAASKAAAWLVGMLFPGAGKAVSAAYGVAGGLIGPAEKPNKSMPYGAPGADQANLIRRGTRW